jgi:beta-glucanase (GH16 family)
VSLLEDGFSGNSLDAFVWDYETDPPVQGRDTNQLQTYTNSLDNIAVVDDILYIKAQRLQDGTYTSGRLNSRPNGGWYPGMALPDGSTAGSVHVEASIQVPTPGQGLWPQFWLAPLEDTYGAWPASGEIDVMQARNNMSSITQALQFGSPWPANSKAEVTTAEIAPFLGDFHTFAADWSADAIVMYVDGRETARFAPRTTDPTNGWYSAGSAAPQAPFDKPFSIVINLAVGGTWPGPPDAATPFPAQMAVQYVHAWAVPQ